MGRRSGKSNTKRVYKVQAVGYAPTCPRAYSDKKGSFIVLLLPAMDATTLLHKYDSHTTAARITGYFVEGFLMGAVRLVSHELGARLPPSMSYLREFTKAMFTHWLLAERAAGALPADPPPGTIDVWTNVARQTPDLATLDGEALSKIWWRMKQNTRRNMKEGGCTLLDIVERWDSLWSKVGKVILRLDDVVDNPTHPFTLSASYYDAITSVQFDMPTPVAAVLFGESRVHKLREYIYGTIRAAAERSAVLMRLVESQEIFAPCRLIPRDAHAFVRDAAALESVGVEVQLPRWWKDLKQPEVHVRAKVGSRAPRRIGIGSLLDIETSYVVGDHELSEAEWRSLIRRDHDGLVKLKGTWVDLTRSRIAAACESARALEGHVEQGGMSYAQALEFTGALVPEQDDDNNTRADESPTPLLTYETGPWLDSAMKAVADRDFRRGFAPGDRLRGELFAYQRQGVAWLSMLLDAGVGACLADDMGLGKTIQVIALLVALYRRGPEGTNLIVVPASLIANWQLEFARFAPTLRVFTEHGSTSSSADAETPPFVVLTTYGTLTRRPQLLDRQWSVVILDEAQEIKNPRALVTTAVRSLRSQMRVCLTGTPVENHLGELWSIMDFLNPGVLGSEAEFRTWCDENLAGPEGMRALRQRVRPYILRRLKSDPLVSLDLPPKVEMTVYCGLTALQSDLYGQTYAAIRHDHQTSLPRQRQGVVLRLLTRLKQICDHPALILGDAFDALSSGKLIRLSQLASTIFANGDRALIFTQYREMTDPIAKLLEGLTGRSGAVIHGKVRKRERDEIIESFQSPDGPAFLVLTYGVGSTGLNLTAASHVILFDRWWNDAVETQAADRAHRIGQTKSVVVHKFICRGTLEERIDILVNRKRDLVRGVLVEDLNDEGIAKMSSEELLSLFALDPALASLEDD